VLYPTSDEERRSRVALHPVRSVGLSRMDCRTPRRLDRARRSRRAGVRLGRYLGPLLASFFPISGLSYKTTFNRELRISNFPLYSI
jgi:hypothetical protein